MGLQKGVMISHHNVISNVMQIGTYDKPTSDLKEPDDRMDVALGLLPLSHIYGLVVIAQASTYRGHEVIILPKFEFRSYLNAIQTFKITALYLVSQDYAISTQYALIGNIGSSYYHSNDQEPATLLKIRCKQCTVHFHWSCTSWCGDRRRSTEDVSFMED